ncbi:MAG: hypothetical protein R3Y43_00070 [Alphaproteobacteria bacterium]
MEIKKNEKEFFATEFGKDVKKLNWAFVFDKAKMLLVPVLTIDDEDAYIDIFQKSILPLYKGQKKTYGAVMIPSSCQSFDLILKDDVEDDGGFVYNEGHPVRITYEVIRHLYRKG